ncbi:MAG: hypothetical protein Q8S84_04955 [bacterium]|nr:hypothetical protein [bacterium]MDP3380846.1 hypothetical protein [bacterium]
MKTSFASHFIITESFSSQLHLTSSIQPGKFTFINLFIDNLPDNIHATTTAQAQVQHDNVSQAHLSHTLTITSNSLIIFTNSTLVLSGNISK